MGHILFLATLMSLFSIYSFFKVFIYFPRNMVLQNGSIGKAYRLLAEWGVWQIVEETKLKGASLSPDENGSLEFPHKA